VISPKESVTCGEPAVCGESSQSLPSPEDLHWNLRSAQNSYNVGRSLKGFNMNSPGLINPVVKAIVRTSILKGLNDLEG